MAGRLAAASRRVGRLDPAMVAGLVTALAAVAVYRTTLLPGLGAWDTAEAQTVLPVMGTFHPTGFPAYVVLGWLASVVLAPFGSPAFVINLLSALLAAFAVGTSVLVMRRLDVPLPIGVAVAVAFALTPVVWRIGSAADAHALHLALVVALTLGLLRWGALVAQRRDRPDDTALRRRGDRAIVLTAAVFGVAVANHALSLLLVPAVALYVLAVEPRVVLRPRLVAAALGAALGVTALLYLELPLRAGLFRAPLVYGRPETWDGFWEIVAASQFQGEVVGFLSDPAGRLGAILALAQRQLGILVVLVPAALLVTAVRQPRYALFSLTATVITSLFAASYNNAAIERYYLGPVFFAWTWVAVLAGTVAERLAAQPEPGGAPAEAAGEPANPAAEPEPADGPRTDGPRTDGPRTGRPRLDVALLAGASGVAAVLGLALLVPTAVDLHARWRTADRSEDAWAGDWVNQVFEIVEQDAVVVSWWSYSTPLWYGQHVEGRRPDVWVLDDRTRLDAGLGEVEDVIDRFLGTRPVYLIRAQESEINRLSERYAIAPVDRPDNLFRVTGRLETQP